MEQLLSGAWNTAPIIAGLAIAAANVLIYLKGGNWTPRKRAIAGIVSVLVVFGIGYWASPAAFPETRQGVVNLVVMALVLVLAAAGVPVYTESLRGGKVNSADTAAGDETAVETTEGVSDEKKALAKARTWGVWSQ